MEEIESSNLGMYLVRECEKAMFFLSFNCFHLYRSPNCFFGNPRVSYLYNGSLFNRGVSIPLERVVVQSSFQL